MPPWPSLDPACVKTHTIAKCRKYNSPTRYRTSCAQHDSTPWCAISSRCFYVRSVRWSFRTANAISRHMQCSAVQCSAVQQTAQLFDHLVISDARLNSAGEHLLRLREIFTWPVE